ncbi:MAG: hypothetical protein JRH20_24470, partial [Deltaproteobacteria bacterium]|nr:hypothetical protein [Deltaproteobacteria bacterium]
MRWSHIALVLVLCGVAPQRASAKFQLVPTVGFGDTFTCIGISHRDPNFVMIGTATGRLHRTIDGGKTWEEVWVLQHRSLFFGRERQADPTLEYALGLPGKSPHLQSWLRQKGLHTSGVNLQQFLVKEGDKPSGINWIEVDWHDENRVWVATSYGLYRSLNKGRSFVRIWQGRSGQAQRTINAVVTDPGDPKTLIVGTAGGLFISRDRGISLKKEMNFYVHGGFVRALYYDREMKGLLHMAMGGAAMASPDHGKNWITTRWHLWSPRSQVQWISLGPNNIRAMATRDGVFASWQGGEMGTWVRRGHRLTKQDVISVMIAKS